MNEILTIVEHESLTISENRNINNNEISYLDSELLFEIEYTDKKDKKRFLFSRNGKNKIKASSIVGSVSLKNGLTIEILPKFAKGKLTSILKKQYRETLISMIRVSNEKNLITSKSQSSKIHMGEMPLINYIIELFTSSLISTLRQGVYNTYTKEILNTSNIRGNILVSKTIQKNLIDKSKVYCTFNKHSSNNLLMQIFKTLAKLLMEDDNLSYGTKKNLYEIYILLDDVDVINLKVQDFNKIVFNRLNDKYEILFNQAKFIFSKYIPFSSKINSTPFWSILFSMDYLFEKFLAYLFKKSNIKFNEQSIIKSFVNKSHNMTVSAKPDFIIESNLCVVDAKWKLMQMDKTLYGLNSQNFWQLLSYMNLIDKDNQLNGYFIVPKNSDEFDNEIVFDSITEGNKSITIISIDFSLPFNEIINNFYFVVLNEKLHYKKVEEDIHKFDLEKFIEEVELLSKNKNYVKTVTTLNKSKFINIIKLKNIQKITTRIFKEFIKVNLNRDSLAFDNLEIDRIPTNIKKFKKLIYLKIHNNNIDALPDELFLLKKLKILNISGNNITKLSELILNIPLKSLYLDILTINENKELIDKLIIKCKTKIYYPHANNSFPEDTDYDEYKSTVETEAQLTLSNKVINFTKPVKEVSKQIAIEYSIEKINKCYTEDNNSILNLASNNNLEDFQKIILFLKNYESFFIQEEIRNKLLLNTSDELSAFFKKIKEINGIKKMGYIFEKNYKKIENNHFDWLYGIVNIRYIKNESIPIIYILSLIAKNTIHRELVEFLIKNKTEQKILKSLLNNYNKDKNDNFIINEKLINMILDCSIELKNIGIAKYILLRKDVTLKVVNKLLTKFDDKILIDTLESIDYFSNEINIFVNNKLIDSEKYNSNTKKNNVESSHVNIDLSIDKYLSTTNYDKETFVIESDLTLCNYEVVKRLCYETNKNILEEIVYNKTLPQRFLFLIYILNFKNIEFKEQNIFAAIERIGNENVKKMIKITENYKTVDVVKYFRNNFASIDDEILFGYGMSDRSEVFPIRKIICELTSNLDLLDVMATNKNDINILINIVKKANGIEAFRSSTKYKNILLEISKYTELDKQENGDVLIKWLFNSYNNSNEAKDYLRNSYGEIVNNSKSYVDTEDDYFFNHINL